MGVVKAEHAVIVDVDVDNEPMHNNPSKNSIEDFIIAAFVITVASDTVFAGRCLVGLFVC